jgi:hypothetical protein
MIIPERNPQTSHFFTSQLIKNLIGCIKLILIFNNKLIKEISIILDFNLYNILFSMIPNLFPLLLFKYICTILGNNLIRPINRHQLYL